MRYRLIARTHHPEQKKENANADSRPGPARCISKAGMRAVSAKSKYAHIVAQAAETVIVVALIVCYSCEQEY